MSCGKKLSRCYTNKNNISLLNKLKGKHYTSCANCIKKLNGSESSFIFKSFSDLVNQKDPLQLSNNQKKILQTKLKPFGTIVKPFISPRTSNSNREKLIRKKVSHQTGQGVISLVVAAVVPLIADLISKAIKKK